MISESGNNWRDHYANWEFLLHEVVRWASRPTLRRGRARVRATRCNVGSRDVTENVEPPPALHAASSAVKYRYIARDEDGSFVMIATGLRNCASTSRQPRVDPQFSPPTG